MKPGPYDGNEQLVTNIIHFVHALRKAGVRVGMSQVEDAVRALIATGVCSRLDFFHTLRCVLVNRPADMAVFEQVFALFWRDPDFHQRMIRMMSPLVQKPTDKTTADPAARRAQNALAAAPNAVPQEKTEEPVRDAALSWSATARLRSMDFEQMNAAELDEAAHAIAALDLPVPPLTTRRLSPARRGARPDMRATLRRSVRLGGELDRIVLKAQGERPPNLVALCDISGSMSIYSRMLILFLHTLAHARHRNWGRVRVFTFGTELTNISHALGAADPDQALAAVADRARDWQGGTLIGQSLKRFNKDWARRVLGRGAVALLITDGLERSDPDLLRTEMARLHRSCRRLLWLNPLLRYDGFQPLAGGIRAMLPHVDGFYACHSLDSLSDLVAAFAGPDQRARLSRVA